MNTNTGDEKKKQPLMDFAYLGRIDEFLTQLKDIAMPENWDYSKRSFDKPMPILYNYLNHTFMRLKEQNKIVEKQPFFCFNTGLVTEHQQEIFALFKKNDKGTTFIKFCKESDSGMSFYSPLPERATYFDDPAELIFDNRLDFRIKIDHIVEDKANFERFPFAIQALPKHQLINTFNGAIEHAKKRVNRNYKTAIPQFYRGQYVSNGQLQLLLPLCLTDTAKADLALAIFKEKGFYSGRTCLTLDMAINNARLIAKPDEEWLLP
ncbi:MAG: DUF3825 domain-containing protein [Bacteroidota bacterium]|nr:DUF3825 domain-containing protein [Bacteroidota bacterium]